MGFVTFPREWEGLHEAFPAYPTQFDNRSPISPNLETVLLGAIGGSVWNLVRAIQRRPLSLAVLNGIGICAIPLTAFTVFAHERGRAQVKSDVRAILQADNIELPRRKLIKTTTGVTPDTGSTVGGVLAVWGLMIYRRAPNFPKVGILAALGVFRLGQLAGSMSTVAWNEAVSEITPMQYQISCMKASQIFTQRTSKPPPHFLYGLHASDMGKGVLNGQTADPFGLLSGDLNPSESAFGSPIPGDMVSEGGDSMATYLPQNSGSQPHIVMMVKNGEKVFAAQRDYEWNPDSAQEGLETLRDNLDDLNKARVKHVSTAEFLWNTIAQREAQHYPPYGRENDSDEVVLERKALELLTSIHKEIYSQIADIDWCISNTKKLILQFQSDGKWLPNSSSSATAHEARERILVSVRLHKQNLEVQEATVEATLKVMPGLPHQKEEIRRAISENLAATAKLIEDLEDDANKGK